MSFYPYFIPSLPALQFGGKAPFSYERLCALSEGVLSSADRVLLTELPNVLSGTYSGSDPVVAGWLAFDTALRNELVRIRAARRHKDPALFVRPGTFSDISQAQTAMQAWRSPHVLEMERALDRARWEFLDESMRGHFFDRQMLFAYGMQLLIALRWERLRSQDARARLEDALQATKERK